MIELILSFTLSIFFPLIFGYTLLCATFPKNSFSPSFTYALSFGVGLGILGQWMLLLDILKLSIILINITIPLSIVSLFIIYKSYRTKHNKIKILIPKTHPQTYSKWIQYTLKVLTLILIVFIAIDIFQTFWLALNIPIRGWDSVATIAYKAKVFYYQQTIPPLATLPHKDYPFFTSLIETWMAMNLNSWHDQYVKFLFPVMLVSFLTIVYHFLNLYLRKTWSLLAIVFILSSNFLMYHATLSYADFSLMYYNCLTIIFLIIYYSTKNKSFLILSGILAGFATFVKLEGTAFLVIYIILLLIICAHQQTTLKNKIKDYLKFLIPSLSMCSMYFILKYYGHALKEDALHMDKTHIDFTFSKLKLIPDIGKAFMDNLLLSGNWGIIWFIFLLTLLNIKISKHLPEIKILILSIFLFFCLYGGVALLSSNYIWIAGENRLTGLSRLLLHFYPLAPISLALMFFQKVDNKS